MEYVNVGAMDALGQRIKTKKALKEAVQTAWETEDYNLVGFDQTAMLQSGRVPSLSTISDLPDGVTLSVVGPDPYSKRNWYASVYRNGDKVVVK